MCSPSENAPKIGWIEAATRWMYLLRYHHPEQFLRRAITRGRTWALRVTHGGRYARPLPFAPEICPNRNFQSILERKLSSRRDGGTVARARAALEGRFCFLNQELHLGNPVNWRLAGQEHVDPLWRFQLHYHEFLLDLLVETVDLSSPFDSDAAWDLVLQWVRANSVSDPRTFGDAWHPFCISRRLPVWAVLWQAAPPAGETANTISESMYRQATFLASHLERDVGGNHLLENARALALTGIFFAGPDAARWRSLARTILAAELPRQILAHGEHFERSPMYHVQTLDALLDIRDAVEAADPELAQLCRETTERMAGFLTTILHPDGEIPLLSDSVFRQTPAPCRLIHEANGHATEEDGSEHARRIGDYWAWRNGGDFFLMDAGPVAADHLPAHAHSDLLTIEASSAGRRLIVDSGAYAYRDDALRRYCRSTAAHNVLQVDGREQCDTWSRFRMGYRGRPTGLETGRTGQFDWARSGHNAYRRTRAPKVARWVACRRGGPWLIVDWAMGDGEHRLSNWLHLHPDVQVEHRNAREIHLRLGPQAIRLGTLTPGDFEIREGMYCPEFGRRLEAPVVEWTTSAKLPKVCGWYITFGRMAGTACFEPDDRGGVLRWMGDAEECAFGPAIVFGESC